MKAGTDDKNKTRVAVVLFAIAALVAVWQFWPSAPAPQATPPPRASSPKNQHGSPVFSNLDPTLRLDLLKGSEQVTYSGSGRDIFHAQAEPAKPDVDGVGKVTDSPLKPIVPTTPANPPIPLKFYGFASANNNKQIFLSQGEEIWVVKEGDIVKGRYKVVHVNANNVEIQDVLANYSQQIPLTLPNS